MTVIRSETKKNFRFFAAFFFAAALFLCAQEVHADYWQYTWKGSTSTDWADPSNWDITTSGGVTPTPAPTSGPSGNGDVVRIPNLGTTAQYPVISTAIDLMNPSDAVPHGSGSVTIENNATLTINSTNGSLTCGIVSIATGGKLVNNGSLTSKAVGGFTGSSGNLANDGIYSGTGTLVAQAISGGGSFTFVRTVNAASVNITGLCSISANVTTSGEQTYKGQLTITSTPTMTATGGDITLAAVTGPGSLIVNAGSHNVILNGVIGTGAGLNAFTTAGTTGNITINANITTSGVQTYTGPVTIAAAAILATNGSSINFEKQVTLDNSLTAKTGTGTVTFKDAVSGAHDLTVTGNADFKNTVNTASLSVSGTTAINTASITTSGNQTYTGTVTVNTATSLSARDVTFGSTLVSNSTLQTLTLNAGTAGNILFSGAAGTVTQPIGTLTVVSAQNVTVNGAVYSQGFDQQAGTGTTILTGKLDTNVNGIQIKTNAIKISGGIQTSSTCTLVNTGLLEITNAINSGSFTQTDGNPGGTSATVELGANITAANNDVSFDSPLTLTKTVSINSGTGNITFGGAGTTNAVINAQTGTQGLTVSANTPGKITFNGAVGAATPLASLTSTGTGTTYINGGGIASSGAQSYTGPVVFSPTTATATAIAASQITFSATLDADAASASKDLSLTANGENIIFTGAVGSTTTIDDLTCTVPVRKNITFTNSFAQNPAKSFIITNGNLTIGANTFIAGNITLNNSTFTQTGANGVNTQSVGSITLGSGTTMEWAQTTTEAGSLIITGTSITAAGATLDFGYKNIIFNSTITLNTLTLYDMTIAATGNVTLSGPLTVRRNVTIDGGGSGGGQLANSDTLTLGGTGTADGVIQDNNTSGTNNFGIIIIDQGSTTKTFDTSITAKSITINGGSRAITFNTGASLVLTDTATALALGNGSGTKTFQAVNASNAKVDLGDGSGAVTFNGGLTAKELTNTGGSFDLFFNAGAAGQTTAVTNAAVTLNTSGAVSFGNSTNDQCTFSGGLTINNTSKITLGGTLTVSAGDITFPKAVTLDANSTVTMSPGNGKITFSDKVDVTLTVTAASLTLNSTGNVTFEKPVGGTKKLLSLAKNGTGTTAIYGGTVDTTGAQFYSGSVTINSIDTTLTSNNANITLTGAVTLNKNLAISTGTGTGNISFGAAVNGTTPNTQDLTLTAGAGSVIFTGAVGTTAIPLGTVTINSASTALNRGVQINSNLYATAFSVATLSNVFISGLCTFNVTNGTVITFPANLFIAAGRTNAVSFNKNIQVTQNLVLFSGSLTLPTQTGIGKDFVLLNGNAASMYGLGDIYTYNGSGRYGKTASLTSFPSQVPGNTLAENAKISSPYYGVLTDLGGKTITVGQNFYANGVNLQAGSSWNLNLKGNENADDAFAEAYNLRVSHSEVRKTSGTGTYAWIAAAKANDGSNNSIASDTSSGWAFSRPKLLANNDTKATGESLSGTYTIYDDVIRIELSSPVYNRGNEIIWAAQNLLQYQYYSGAPYVYKTFSNAYSTADCTTALTAGEPYSVFYLKTKDSNRWNTDATGLNQGAADSTDRGRTGTGNGPAHQQNLPSITFAESNRFKDKFKNRVEAATNYNTADRCRPVLVEVRTGQETHKPFTTQKPYDAHNFIELRYSEPVTIPGVGNSDQNIQVTAALGAITQNGTGTGLDIAGFAHLASGKLSTGTQTSPTDNTVHALYRAFTFDGIAADAPQSHRIRISIAGWATGPGLTGYEYPGYIDSAETPSGLVTVFANRNIKDLSAAVTGGNPLEPTDDTVPADDTGYGLNRNTNHPKAAITVDASVTPQPNQVLYGGWDTNPPIPAPIDWNNLSPDKILDNTVEREVLGSADSAGNVTEFGFHFFDNNIPVNTTLDWQWYWKLGWYQQSNVVPGIKPEASGGSRPDYTTRAPASGKTAGGLRAATLASAESYFTIYDAADSSNLGGFQAATLLRTVNVPNFFGNQTDIPAATNDTLYVSMQPVQSLAARDTFTIRYAGYITDLAGNRIPDSRWRTTDRIPPKITFTATPLDDTHMLVFFNKKLDLELHAPPAGNATINDIHEEFTFYNQNTIEISGLNAVSARLVLATEDVTAIVLTLSQSLTMQELTTGYISLKSYSWTDPFTLQNFDASKISDTKGNWMDHKVKIPVTYLGLNMLQPLFATNGLSQDSEGKVGTVTVHPPFDGSGSLYYDRIIRIQTRFNFTPAAGGTTPLTLWMGVNPDPESVSTTFNQLTGKDLNFWLPGNGPILPPVTFFAPVPNSKAVSISQIEAPNSSEQIRNFDVPVDRPQRQSGDLMQFLFQYGTFKTPNPDTGILDVDSPFYLVPLTSLNDLLSFRLYAFKALAVNSQRGGTTILNNVINTNNGDETILEVIMPKTGNLNVSVMTLDGNVIKYLHRGRAEEGKHYFRWNGTNNGGRSVARGMYFVRISGTGIDETRKVMVVRD